MKRFFRTSHCSPLCTHPRTSGAKSYNRAKTPSDDESKSETNRNTRITNAKICNGLLMGLFGTMCILIMRNCFVFRISNLGLQFRFGALCGFARDSPILLRLSRAKFFVSLVVKFLFCLRHTRARFFPVANYLAPKRIDPTPSTPEAIIRTVPSPSGLSSNSLLWKPVSTE